MPDSFCNNADDSGKAGKVRKGEISDACSYIGEDFIGTQAVEGLTQEVEKGSSFVNEPTRLFQEAPLFIEACCGCALLSACVSKLGFDLFPTDFSGNKHRPHAHIVELGLRKDSTWEFLRYVVNSRRPFHFHCAPPCATASRARNKRLNDLEHGPPPLRSSSFPLGFPWLVGIWKGKVASANCIYINLAGFLVFLDSRNIFWSVENPAFSYF